MYVGCFANHDGNRVNGHVSDKSVAECRALAAAAGTLYFGMEYPQGSSVAGEAQCLLLDAPPSMVMTDDSECEGGEIKVCLRILSLSVVSHMIMSCATYARKKNKTTPLLSALRSVAMDPGRLKETS